MSLFDFNIVIFCSKHAKKKKCFPANKYENCAISTIKKGNYCNVLFKFEMNFANFLFIHFCSK